MSRLIARVKSPCRCLRKKRASGYLEANGQRVRADPVQAPFRVVSSRVEGSVAEPGGDVVQGAAWLPCGTPRAALSAPLLGKAGHGDTHPPK